MQHEPDESPRLLVLKLDNGELGEDLTEHEQAATNGSPGATGATPDAGHEVFEVVESHGLSAVPTEVDPSDLRPGSLSRHARHPSTDRRSHPAQIEEEI